MSLSLMENENPGLDQVLTPTTSSDAFAACVARLIAERLRCHVVQIIHDSRATLATIARHTRDKKNLKKINRSVLRHFSDQICVISDCSTSDHPAATSMYRLDDQYRSCIAVPMMTSSQKIGLVIASDDVKRQWTNTEIDSICDLASIFQSTRNACPELHMLDVQKRMQRSLVQFTRSNVASLQALDGSASHLSSISLQSDLDEDLDLGDIEEETTQVETSRMNIVFDLSARLIRRTLAIDGCILLNIKGLWEYENVDASLQRAKILGACFLRHLRTGQWHEDLAYDNSQSMEVSGDIRSADEEMKARFVDRKHVFDTSGLTPSWIEDILHNNSRNSIFNEGHIPDILLKLLPIGTTSVLMTPIYDNNMRPFALILAFDTHQRQFVKCEGHYLEAFSSSIYAEVLNQNLQEANQSKALFISKISHEFRTPLHGILASAEFLNDILKQDPVPLEFVQTIDACGRTLLDIINHVLEYSKLKYGNNTSALPQDPEGIVAEDFDVIQVLEQIIQTSYSSYEFRRFGDQIDEYKSASRWESSDTTESSGAHNLLRNVEVIVVSPYRPQGYIIHSDNGAFRQIMLNIIGNALRFTLKGHVIISIRFSNSQEDDLETLNVSVEDTGVGISTYFLDHLFKPFSQESDFSSGTGLGLSIVKELIGKLHGTIRVQSIKEHGSTFHLAYPVVRRHSPQTLFPGNDMQRELGGTMYHFLHTRTQDDSARLFRDCTMRTIDEWFGMKPSRIDECELLIVDDLEDDKQGLEVSLQQHSGATVIFSSTVVKYERGLMGSRRPLQSYISKPCGPYRLGEAIRKCLAIARSIDRLKEQDSHHSRSDLVASDDIWQEVETSDKESPIALSTVRERSTGNFSGGDRRTVREVHEEQTMANIYELKNKGKGQDQGLFLPSVGNENDIRQISAHSQDINTSQKVQFLGSRPPVLTSEESTRSTERSQGRHILIVEDNSVNMMLLIRFAKKEGLKVSTADNGALALSAIRSRKSPFAAILMDINMPVMNGFETIARIREHEAEVGWMPTKVAAITGLSMDSDRLEARQRGADAFLTKPVRMATLRSILRDWKIFEKDDATNMVVAST